MKRLYQFVLKRLVGRFLRYELLEDTIDVELSKGTVTLRDVELNTDVYPATILCL